MRRQQIEDYIRLQLIKWKGNATAKLLVDEFKATYPRRSALLDELQKVEKKL